MSGDPDDVLAEQVEYYRARAAEYDDWWERRGRYDRGADATAAWRRERAEVLDAFDRLALRGDVLELASGTGIWTERLVRTAASVTAVDASAEMIAINRARLGAAAGAVAYVEADLFAWAPARTFDCVVFCFWLSHVPRARFDGLVGDVASWLRPGGRLFFVDGRREATSTAVDHELPVVGDEVMTRRLDDGSTYRVVKNFWAADELERRFAEGGLDVLVRETPRYFQYGIGSKRAGA